MEQVWGIGRRKFGKEWGERKQVRLFDKLISSVVSYGAKVWS